MIPDRHKVHKQHSFDCFCKRVLRCEAYNIYREIRRRAAREVSISELTNKESNQLAVYDHYSWEYTHFRVGSHVIAIENDLLANALFSLPHEDVEILLMYWFLDMTDKEIAFEKNMARRTVNHHRQKACRLLKKHMEGCFK